MVQKIKLRIFEAILNACRKAEYTRMAHCLWRVHKICCLSSFTCFNLTSPALPSKCLIAFYQHTWETEDNKDRLHYSSRANEKFNESKSWTFEHPENVSRTPGHLF